MNILSFFKESDGSLSMMRLLTFLLVLTGLGIIIYGCLIQKPNDYLSAGSFLIGFGITGKLVQKPLEKDNG